MSITDQVAEKVRSAIVAGKYKPGSSLSESNLSDYFQVSRTPVREALKQLEREGLIEIIPRVGTRVKKSTEKELTELFTVKEVLEGLAAAQITDNKDEQVIEELERNVLAMEEAVRSGDQDKYVEANKKFHANIVEGANNSKLTFSLNLLMNQIPYQQYVHMTIEAPRRIEKSLAEHRYILEKIKEGDAEAAESAMRAHVKASESKLKERITEELLKS